MLIWGDGVRIDHTLGSIIDFLGYVPFKIGESVPEKLRAYRAIRGMTQEAVAAEMGIDETTWRQWEAGISRPRFARSLAVIEEVERYLDHGG